MKIETDTTPREELNGREPTNTTIQPRADSIDNIILYSPPLTGTKERKYMETIQRVDRVLLEPEKARTGINRKFDSIMLGISSSVCFGLVAGAVIGLWAVPIGALAGFYIAYKTYQDSAS